MPLDMMPAEDLVEVDPVRKSFRVHRDAYRSAEVFEREKELIFSKCWLYVGHGSELKKPGDYVSRRVGGRDLVFVRDRKGEVRCYYNSCTHRGAKFCREKGGNARTFSCPYHGWVFNTEGKLVTTNADVGYQADLNDDGHLDLKPAERLESYRNFYFVNFNPRAVSLSDYLAEAKSAIDAVVEQAETEQVIVPGEHSYSIKANYKLLCENSYDGYHLASVHASFLDFVRDQAAGTPSEKLINESLATQSTSGQTRGLGNGHALLESYVPSGRPVAQWLPSMGLASKPAIEAAYDKLVARLGEARAKYIAHTNKNLVVFPNLVINDIGSLTVRTIEPESVDFMRVHAWAMGPADEPAGLRDIRLDNFVSFLGPAGFGSPDDIEMLEICQQGFNHTPIEWNELSKGMNSADPRHDVGGPVDEVHMQAYWTQWDRVMRGVETLEE